MSTKPPGGGVTTPDAYHQRPATVPRVSPLPETREVPASGSDVPPPPSGTGDAGAALWQAVVADYELSEHELSILVQAVHVADVCAELQALVDEDGLMKDGRAHPALVELRMQRILLTRLIVALRVPLGDEDNARSQYRGPRGVYAIRGGA